METGRNKISAYFWMMRPLNAFTAAFAVVYALIFANETLLDWRVYAFAASAAFFTTAHSMVHNDIVDVEIDMVNAPYRALPSKQLSMKEAKVFALFLLLFAVLSGYAIDILTNFFPFSTLWALGNSILLDSYNKWLKKFGLIGNFIVGFSPYALFLYADLLIYRGLTIQVEAVGLLALGTIWGREVFKGIYDIPGDSAHGVRTIAVVYGRRMAAFIGSLIVGSGVLATIPLLIDDEVTNPYLKGVFAIVDFILMYKCIRLLQRPTDENAFKTKLFMLRLLLLAILSITMITLSDRYF